MAAPRGSFSRPFPRVEPSHGPQEPVLAVGWRVILRRSSDGKDQVPLSDEDGITTLATVKAGSEVEITAWRPRRGNPALYRVRTANGSKEGWVSATGLERKPAPAVAKPSRAAAPAPSRAVKSVVRGTPKSPRKGARAR
jgi:hypothetical protein